MEVGKIERISSLVIAAAAVCSLIVSLLYAFFTYLQIRRMDEAIVQAEAHFVTDERPYIYLTDNLGFPAWNEHEVGDNTVQGQAAWNWEYTNYGKSPAYKVRTRSVLFVEPDGTPPEPHFELSEPGISIVPPGKRDFSTAYSHVDMSQSELASLIASRLGAVVARGLITYEDRFGNVYETHFCLRSQANGIVNYCGSEMK